MKDTIFNALLRRCKTEKCYTNSVFLEFEFRDYWMSIFLEFTFENYWVTIEHSEDLKLTKSQKEQLIKLAISKRELEPNQSMEDYHPKRPM